MSGTGTESGWETYSRLVLQQLEDLSANMAALHKEIQELKVEIVELRARESSVHELKVWKDKIDEVVSPTQMAGIVKDMEELKAFKIKAITVFTVIQFAMGMIIFLERYF